MHRRQSSSLWAAVLCGGVFSLLLAQPLASQGFCRKCKHEPPSCEDAKKAWEKYKRDIKIVTTMFQEVDSENVRALQEFDSAAEDIAKEIGIKCPNCLGPAPGRLPPEPPGGIESGALPHGLDLVQQQDELDNLMPKIEDLDYVNHELAGEVSQGEYSFVDQTAAELASEIRQANLEGGAVTGLGLAAELAEAVMWWQMKQDAVANLDRSEQSQLRMLRQADEKWKQVLNDYANAVAKDAECAADKKKLADEQDLERRAAHYIENLEGGYHRADGSWQRQWVIHNRAYNDYQSAINAARQILGGPPSSGSLMERIHFRYASVGGTPGQEGRDTVRLTLAQAQRLDTLLKSIEGDIRDGGAADSALVDLYIANWRATHAWIARITRPRS